jgi:glycerol uptake facilitator-like aquaporin
MNHLGPVGIRLTLFSANLVAVALDGGSINPARNFALMMPSPIWSSGNWAIDYD